MLLRSVFILKSSGINDLRVTPELFKIVKLSAGLVKDMDYDRSVIHCDPVTLGCAFNVKGMDTALCKSVLHLVGKSLDVSCRTSLANYKVVTKRGLLFDLEYSDPFGKLFVKDGVITAEKMD